ncbi:MAG: radical SAM family heme chaperone HemW [Lachnospiraceae bacterium]|nr:radical SAM family heme chaperone HemW [Lachnospiraceae bacterium]
MRSKDLSLYIHIPFCVRKCAYCDFLSFSAEDSLKERYIDRLCKEILNEAARYKDRYVISVFFGGGTPSVLRAEQTGRIMELIGSSFNISANAEISIEVNPKTADKEKFEIYKRAGINRISIGCQSLNDKELEVLGRIHRQEDFYRTFQAARDAGFDNINVDMMSALPGQTAADYESSLKKLLCLKPEHISAYSLIIEEGTPFFERYQEDALIRDKGGRPRYLPDEDEERRMLYLGRDILKDAGYHQYEISNYALTGYECRHNKVYWQRGDYAGFGLGASSCVDECRWKNTEDPDEYLSAGADELKQDIQKLDITQQCSEAMFLGLRLMRGVDEAEFAGRYGIEPSCLYREWIDRMMSERLMESADGRLTLTQRGQDLANYVWGGFV